ncbi:hypothetical protein BIW11_11924 [Tropilaelaps mercedesae]|uniref:Uncharacterized protein n=1 Tax=Tropilaelaps mercedesae TaxID=418985 RepID=A0A1V9X8U8_9ACAR|nr:hypothetical protein BIW11_11924 [Tropilaelaps mercedesae]
MQKSPRYRKSKKLFFLPLLSNSPS